MPPTHRPAFMCSDPACAICNPHLFFNPGFTSGGGGGGTGGLSASMPGFTGGAGGGGGTIWSGSQPFTQLQFLAQGGMITSAFAAEVDDMKRSKPEQILRALVKKIGGPIQTYCVGSLKQETNTHEIAYTQLKWVKRSKESRIINIQIRKIIISPEYLPMARSAAVKDGWVSVDFLGEPTEQQCIQTLINIGRVRRYRANNRYQLKDAYDKLKVYYKVKRASWPDPKQPDTLGWRVWHWNLEKKLLRSPAQNCFWQTAELKVAEWSQSAAVRGVAGIHAALMPYDWRKARLEDHSELQGFSNPSPGCLIVHGIVERFGKYVMGTEGWRAEWVIIRALKAPNTEVGLAIEARYPEVEVYYEDR